MPAFAVALHVTVAPPLPLEGLTVNQFALLAAVQAAAGVTVTLKVPLPAAAAAVAEEEESVIAAPASVTSSDCPYTVIAALLGFTPVLAVKLYPIVPLPDPDGVVTVNHEAVLEAAHSTPAGEIVRLTLPVPAAAPTAATAGASVTCGDEKSTNRTR